MNDASQADDDAAAGSRPATLAVAGPIDVRSAALALLALFATLWMLAWAKAVLITLVFSILVSYSLDPIVSTLQRLRLPRWLGAGLLLCALLGLIGYGSYTLGDQARALLDKVPQAVQTVKRSLRIARLTQGPGMIEKVQQAAEEIQKVTAEAGGGHEPPPPGVTRVQIMEPGFKLGEYVWWGSMGALALVGQLATVVLLVYLFLVSGDLYKRKLVRITGPTLSKKKITVQILDDFNMQIRRYLFVLLLSGVFVGVLTWLAYLWIGLEQAALWGLIAGVASAVPYLGPAVVFVLTGIAGLVQFGTVSMGLVVAFAGLFITSVQGYWLTPWLTSRSSRINAVVVFVGLLFWGWLWGPIGLVVATPILIIVKVCCDHIENLKPIGELMGGRSG